MSLKCVQFSRKYFSLIVLDIFLSLSILYSLFSTFLLFVGSLISTLQCECAPVCVYVFVGVFKYLCAGLIVWQHQSQQPAPLGLSRATVRGVFSCWTLFLYPTQMVKTLKGFYKLIASQNICKRKKKTCARS